MIPFTPTLPPSLISVPQTPPAPETVAAKFIIDKINEELNHQVMIHKMLWNKFWNNNTASPSAVALALGDYGPLVFEISNENINHITNLTSMVNLPLSSYLNSTFTTAPSAFTIDNGTISFSVSGY